MDINRHDRVMAEKFKALGSAVEAKDHHPMPKWLCEIVDVHGGVEAYRSKAKEHNNIKGS